MSADDLRALGYEFKSGRWYLVNPDAKPSPRPNLCRMCSKFTALFDGWCVGCLWFSAGDPLGLRRTSPEVGVTQRELPATASRAVLIARAIRRLKEGR
jgi:hypothetical protein